MSIKLKTISVFLSVATALTLSGAMTPLAASAASLTQAQIDAIVSLLQSFGADSATISNVQSALTGGAVSGTTGGTYNFATDLSLGSTGADVMNLQKVLNMSADTQVASSGVGSPGNETTYFGSLTKAAAMKFQAKYGISPVAGYVGPITRAKLNSLYGGVSTGGGVVVTPQGTGLTVTAGAQPAASIAPADASRIPFTVVNFTASSDGDVTVNSLVIERTGLANDAVFAGIVLLDENYQQIGLEKTLNSVHQVTLSEPFTIKAGQTKTMTIAGNRAAYGGSHAGEIAYLSLVSVSTSAAVHGSLPITGTGQTINESLVIGSVTMARGPLDPAATTSNKEIGTTGFIFSSVKVTAGSQEKVNLKSIRWYQSGSVASGDLANVKTYVDGTAYDAVVSSDGKYYTSSFGTGISIDKGFSKEIYVKGDIVGGSARTIKFDIYKQTDLYLVGETYGYGITPPVSSTVTGFHSTTPWYYAFDVTIGTGSMTVSKATSVEAQNIAINLANQPLGGFVSDVKGEAISVGTMTFTLSSTTIASAGVSNISLFDENGAVVAGPEDVDTDGTIDFNDTVTFPTGIHTYTLKGKLGTTFSSDEEIYVSFAPSSDWGTVKGSVTGVTITPSGGTITGNTMTVKAGYLAVSVSSIPLQQTVIAGTTQFLFANYVLDAGNSGEDVSLPALQVAYTASSSGNAQKLTNCKLYDGSAVLTGGSNIKNPTSYSSSTSFTFDNPLTISKGTVKTIALKCDIAGNTTAGISWSWGYDKTNCDISPTGKVSGQGITETVAATQNGQPMTSATGGTYTVVDDSTPGYSIVAAGTTGVTLLQLKFSAVNEDIDISRVNFQLAATATNSPEDLVNKRLTLYDAANPTVAIATADFTTSDYATSTLIASGSFRIPSGQSKHMIVKGDIAGISYTVGPIQKSGELVRVAYDGGSNGIANGNYGKGVSSGTTVDGPSITDVTSTGVRIMKAYPSLARDAVPSTTLVAGAGFKAYRFHVTASNGDVYLSKLTFEVSSSTGGTVAEARTSQYSVYAYIDSGYSLLDSTINSTNPGLLNDSYYISGKGINSPTSTTAWSTCAGNDCGVDLTAGTGTNGLVEVYPFISSATTTYKVPSGSSRYFELRMYVKSVESGTGSESLYVQLDGDAAYPTVIGPAGTNMAQAGVGAGASTGIDADDNDNFIWSPNSTSTTISLTDLDFTNGYALPGLPSTNMDSVTLISTS